MSSNTLVWLITGTSSGLSKCLVTSLLNRGDYVIATVRNHTTAALAAPDEHKDRLHVVTLDITDSEENISKVISDAWKVWGRVDILVNNAGRVAHSLLEEGGAEVIRDVFETNVLGTVKVTNAILPHMRSQKSGFVVFLGSRAVWQAGTPLASAYISSKAAIHAISEGVAAEVAQFGIRVLLAIPGGLKTSQLNTPYTTNHHVADYDGYRERVLEVMAGHWKHAQGDPEKAMEVLVDVIKGEGRAEGKATPDWLLLGKPTFTQAKVAAEKLDQLVDDWEGISRDLDFDDKP